MKRLSFEEYKESLKSAGPALKDYILERAQQDAGIGSSEFKKLIDIAYPGVPGRKKRPRRTAAGGWG